MPVDVGWSVLITCVLAIALIVAADFEIRRWNSA